MSFEFTKTFTLIILLLTLAGCRAGVEATPRPPTPTFELARFSTATPTAPPTPTPRPSPTPTAAPTLAPTATLPPATPIPAITATASLTATLPAVGQASPAVEQVPPAATAGAGSPLATPTQEAAPTAPPSPTALPTPPPPAGRIAFPIDNGGGRYDVWVMELPAGQPFFVVEGGRQPDFSADGRLLVNLEGSPRGDAIALFDRNYSWLGLLSEAPEDGLPFWSPDGSRYVFANPRRLLDPQTGDPLPYLFIPCSLRLPAEEAERRCQDTAGQSKLAPGNFPVWTDDGRIGYFSYQGDDGLYLIDANATAGGRAAGAEPQWLTGGVSSRPSDTAGGRLYFSAGDIDQNWEAYAVNLDGSGLTNLSAGPDSQDGLPTVSPDGRWVAFVSDRGGSWGIWLVPAEGGSPVRLLDLATINTNPSPWGTGDRDWTNERISWGP